MEIYSLYLTSLSRLKVAEKAPKESLLEDLFWNDPTGAISETRVSPRGAGKLFGQKVTTRFYKILAPKS